MSRIHCLLATDAEKAFRVTLFALTLSSMHTDIVGATACKAKTDDGWGIDIICCSFPIQMHHSFVMPCRKRD